MSVSTQGFSGRNFATKKEPKEKEGGYEGKNYVKQSKKSFKGKRNSPGAKMANFRGERSLK